MSMFSVSHDVRYHEHPTLCIPSGQTLLIENVSEELKGRMEVTIVIRVPAARSGETPVSLNVRYNGSILPQWALQNHGLSQPELRTLGPILLGPDFQQLTLLVTSDDENEQQVTSEPFYLAAMHLGDVELDLQNLLSPQALQQEGDRASGYVEGPAPTTFFTSFEEDYSQIGWIEKPAIYNPVSRTTTIALTGRYSLWFYETVASAGMLQTKKLTLPPNTAAVSFGGWIYPRVSGPAGVTIAVTITMDSTTVQTMWTFSNQESGWIFRDYLVKIPQGTTILQMSVRLMTSSDVTNNAFYLDDLHLDLLPQLPQENRNVLFGTSAGDIIALNASTGNTSWHLPLALSVRSLVVANDQTYGVLGDEAAVNVLFSVRLQNGRLHWKIPLPAYSCQPVITGSWCLCGCADGFLRAYDTQNASLQWEYNVRPRCSIQHILPVRGALVVLMTNKGVGAYDLSKNPKTESPIVWWRYEEQDFFKTGLVSDSGEVYVGSRSGNFFALKLSSGEELWHATFSRAFYTSEVEDLGDVILAYNEDEHLYGLHGQNGNVIWNVPIPQVGAGKETRRFVYSRGIIFASGTAALQLSFTQPDHSDHGHWTSLWNRPVNYGENAPVVGTRSVFVSDRSAGRATISAYDFLSGSRQWSTALESSQKYVTTLTQYVMSETMVPSLQLSTLSQPNPFLSRRYDQVCWLAAHNAYANDMAGWWYAQQTLTLYDQLTSGVRMLMVDVWNCPDSSGADRLVYAHGGCRRTWFQQPFSRFETFEDSLAGIKNWLDNNPQEVVTLYIEQRIGDRTQSRRLMTDALQRSGVVPYRFDPASPQWNVRGTGWPTLQAMVNTNQRLVIFSDWANFSGLPNAAGNDGLPQVWQWAVENQWGAAGRDPNTPFRDGSLPINQNPPHLFIANYNTDWSSSLELFSHPFISFFGLNDSQSILANIDVWYNMPDLVTRQPIRRLPNFLAVDWYEYGDHGGPREVVREMNRRWQRDFP